LVEVQVNGTGGTWQTASGTSSWNASVVLVPGANTIYVRSQDGAGNYSTIASVNVTYNPSDTTPPTASISSPTSGQMFTGSFVAVNGTANDSGTPSSGVSLVEVQVNGTGGTWQTASGTTSWSASVALTPGANTIYVRSQDGAGNYSTIASINVSYNPLDTTPPTVFISGPTSGQTFTASPVAANGTASDPGSPSTGVSLVEVQVNGTGGTWQTASGTGSWSASVALTPGANTIYVRSQDGAGNYSTIASINVTYNPSDTTPPTVFISGPTSGQTFTASPVAVNGTANDPGSPSTGVSLVQVQVNGTGGTWQTASGTGSWSASVALTPGANTIYVRSQDGAGNYSTVASVNMTYNPETTAQTETVSLITAKSAQLNGYVDPNGVSTTIFFQYGLTTNYSSYTPSDNIGTTVGAYGYVISNLTAGTEYHYRIVAYSGTATNFGNDTMFATSAQTYTIMVHATNGTVTQTPDQSNYTSGAQVTLTAIPVTNYQFISWSGDASGPNNPLSIAVNTNLNIMANFAAIGTNITLTVLTNGAGSVTPNLNGKDLKANKNYILTATPKSGNVFLDWTGSITTNKNPLTIRAESSIVLQANFIPNPFLPVRGTYNGLFFNTNGVTEQTAGMLKGLTIGQRGTYSGTLLINGGGHALAGAFNLVGQATNHIPRPASQGGPLLVEMTLNWNNSPPQVTGIVFGTNQGVPWVATNLLADLATNTSPSAEYTMLILPDTNTAPAKSPGGAGYALITNYAGTTRNPGAATARITGALADGTAFSQTVPVSRDGYIPIYANLYASKGLLLGWINLDLTNTAGVGLTWIHPARTTGLYQNGFTNVLFSNQIPFSPWTNSPTNIFAATNLSLVEMINDTNALMDFTVTISNNFKLGEVSGPTPLSGSINSKTGLLKVTIGSGANKTTGYGAILLNETNGAGYFLTKTNAGAFILEP
jgi:hypothetical protein